MRFPVANSHLIYCVEHVLYSTRSETASAPGFRRYTPHYVGAFSGHRSFCGFCCTDTALESRKSMQIDTETQLADDKHSFPVFQQPEDSEKEKVLAQYVEL